MKTIIIAIIVIATVVLSTGCGTQKDGCGMSRGFSGYGNK
jgi:hypothetical protein